MMRSATVRFVRHYVEMVLVMFAGMGALIGLVLLAGVNPDDVKADAPGLALFGMGFSMTAPMVWWMYFRGHSWEANRAMALAMSLPTAATMLFLATGAITDLDTLLGIQHLAMFPAMLVAMLPFRAEYTHGHARVAS
jgi:hypothetical protein